MTDIDRHDNHQHDPLDRPGPADRSGHIAELAPFVAWMATQPRLDELTRRRHRQSVEGYLLWCHRDDGPVSGRRRRYEHHVDVHDRATVRAGLDQYAQYRDIVARTLPLDR